ncbi:helix-turn-helix domain-containing protein [Enterococcus rivorum]|uniref:Mga helix-turn-helix domain-containing protein n=1 Tax=Enterococcus rivorum TaxID=762845 RepID=A0A1E5KX13_9ENTE|nr:helix-turn-helix domain-containing protein [Enterococcus rivorum]MBP2097241.1 hypothetical protein [Enterococcus rivorum]OEH82405.1 hypothetical protein BCR26_02945 [Enterococcus rivorum]
MIEIFLKKQEFSKLEIFKYITFENAITTQDLMTEFNLPRSTTKRYIADINSLLSQHKNTESYQVLQNEEHKYYVTNIDKADKIYFFHKFQELFLQESLTFRVFSTVFIADNINFFDLATELNISSGYLYKILALLNKQLKPYSIHFEKNEQTISIDGSEKNIRVFYTYILYSVHQNLSWPFTKNQETEVKLDILSWKDSKIKKKSLSKRTRLNFFLAIMGKRIKDDCIVHSLPRYVGETIDVFMKFNDAKALVNTRSQILTQNKMTTAEYQLMNLILRMYDGEFDTKVEMKRIGEALNQIDSPIVKFSKDLRKAFFSELPVEKNKKNEDYFLYYAVLHNTYLFCFADSLDAVYETQYSYNMEKTYANSNFRNPIRTLYKKTLENNSVKTPENLVEVGTRFLFTLFNLYKITTLKIFVQHASNSLGEPLIKSELLKLFSSDSIEFVTNTQLADVIISDCVEEINDTSTYFLLIDLFNLKAWRDLADFIKDRLFELSFS